jgi:nucleotide-binding universal stress UspA family protein
MRVLIATDGSEHSLRIVEFLKQRPHILGPQPEVTCLYVSHPPPLVAVLPLGAGGGAVPMVEPEKLAAPMLEALRAAGIEAAFVERAGDPALEIAQLAVDGEFDLIVMGSHGRSGIRRLVLGSVTHKLLSATHVPVLVVR